MEVRNWSEQSNNKHINKDLNMKKHVRFVWRMKLAIPRASFKVFFYKVFILMVKKVSKEPKNKQNMCEPADWTEAFLWT